MKRRGSARAAARLLTCPALQRSGVLIRPRSSARNTGVANMKLFSGAVFLSAAATASGHCWPCSGEGEFLEDPETSFGKSGIRIIAGAVHPLLQLHHS